MLGLYLSRFQRPATGEDVTYLRIAYGGTVGETDSTRVLDEGIERTVWMTLDEVRANRDRLRSGLVLRCIEDFTAGRRLPLDTVFADPSLFDPEVK